MLLLMRVEAVPSSLDWAGYQLLSQADVRVCHCTDGAVRVSAATDILLGYHSEEGWTAAIHLLTGHYGIEVEVRFPAPAVCACVAQSCSG